MRTPFPSCPVWNRAELQLDELGFRPMSSKESTFWGWNTIFFVLVNRMVIYIYKVTEILNY